MSREVTAVEDLRAIVGHPPAVADKVKGWSSNALQDWLAHSPLGFVAGKRPILAEENLRRVLY